MLLDGSSPSDIEQAAQVLARGGLLGLPTETVYGLAADACQDCAVRDIFATKGRPADHPLIVHVASAQDVGTFAASVPDFAQALMNAFWPGPLTLILPRRLDVATQAAGGQDSVGLRCPSHPVAQAVLRAAKALGVQGVAAPSANRFGRVSPTTAEHVQQEFPSLDVIDGGACEVGIESTIVDCTRGVPVLLRPGVITPEQLSQAAGVRVLQPDEPLHAPLVYATKARATQSRATQASATQASAPRASGTLASHYAPQALLRLMSTDALRQAVKDWNAQAHPTSSAQAHGATQQTAAPRLAIWTRQPLVVTASQTVVQHMPADAKRCAHELFAVMRALDAQGVHEIWVEAPPPGPQWDGVRDRLTRASVRETSSDERA